MKRKLTLSLFLTITFLLSTLVILMRIQKVEANGVIFIYADGSFSPSTAPLQRNGDLYTLTDNITTSFQAGFQIQRNNMTLDGAGFTLGGPLGYTFGIELNYRSNVTITNLHIKTFGHGIDSSSSSNIIINGNCITNCEYGVFSDGSSSRNMINENYFINCTNGIWLERGSNNHIVNNNSITASQNYGIRLFIDSNNHTISANTITSNKKTCISVDESEYNEILANNITNNEENGLYLHICSNTTIFGNIIDNNNGTAIVINSLSNSTIKGNKITSNYKGISGLSCSNLNIHENNITENRYGVEITNSPSNSIYENLITGSESGGIILENNSNSCRVYRNNVTGNAYGIWLDWHAYDNIFYENEIVENGEGVRIYISENNTFYGNNFRNNTQQVYVSPRGYVNFWDDGYPPSGLGGNYWSNFKELYPDTSDVYSGSNQDMAGSDGFWDDPFVIDTDNQDNYPIVPEFRSIIILPLLIATTLLTIMFRKRK